MPKPARALFLAIGLAAAGCVGDEGKGDGAADAGADGADGAEGADGADGAHGADGASPPDCLEAPLDCDAEDNDCDGEIDEGGEVELRVWAGPDRDSDGWAAGEATRACPDPDTAALLGGGDCDDRDPASHPGAPEDCLSAGDEDCDALGDCADLDCADRPCAEDCDNGLDDDDDGRTDCDDEDCYTESCPEVCGDGLDNDGDGAADCADAACADPACPEICDDRVDNDADGLRNCDDSDCWGPSCNEDCDDGPHADEDGDGLANCEDSQCTRWCVELCDDADGDEDGLVGCDDPKCTFKMHCWEGVAATAEGLRLRRSVTVTTDARGVRVGRSVGVRADALVIEGGIPSSGGGSSPCWFSLEGLSVGGARADWMSSAHWRTGHNWRSADSLSYAPHPCRSPSLLDVTGVSPTEALSTASTSAMTVGDRVRLMTIQPAGGLLSAHLDLIITAVTPYAPSPSGVGPRTGSQSAWGTLEVVGP